MAMHESPRKVRNMMRTTRYRRTTRTVALLAGAALFLAACGDGDEATDVDTDDDAVEDTTDDDADDTNASAAEGESYNWRFAETHAEDYPTTQADIWFADELRERTDGRIDIEVFSDSQLGEEADVLEQVQLGSIEMTRTNATPVSQFAEEWGVFSLPYVFDDGDHMWNFLLSDDGEDLLDGLRVGGFVGLAYFDSGARHIYTVDGPVNEPSDLEGLNIRVQPGSVPADMIEAFGGSPVVMDFGEVYSGLETGVIDGAENNEPSYVSTGHYEVAPYYSLNGHSRVPEVLLISEDIWESLSAEDQDLIREVAREAIDVQRDLWDAEVESSFQTAQDSGNEIIEVDPAPFQEAVQPLLADFEAEYGDLFGAIDNAR